MSSNAGTSSGSVVAVQVSELVKRVRGVGSTETVSYITIFYYLVLIYVDFVVYLGTTINRGVYPRAVVGST